MNVYAPHTPALRCILWLKLLSSLPRDCRWVLLGDWNFVERREDKSNHRASASSEEEKRLFGELKDLLQVEDKFPSSHNIKFSWDNHKRDGNRILARLDRYYTFSNPANPASKENYRILGDCSLADHLPVRRQLCFETPVQRKSAYVMNATHLKGKTVQDGIRRVWNKFAHLPFFGELRRCVRFYKEVCIKRAEESRLRECHLWQEMEQTTSLLQYSPGNVHHQSEVAQAASQLMSFERLKVNDQRLRSKLKWKEKGDQCSKEFFQAHRERSTASVITALQDEDGSVHT